MVYTRTTGCMRLPPHKKWVLNTFLWRRKPPVLTFNAQRYKINIIVFYHFMRRDSWLYWIKGRDSISFKKIELRNYSRIEEIISSSSHAVGAVLGIAALVIGVVFSALRNNAKCVVSMSVYGATLIILFLMSAIYHGLRPGLSKKVFRVIDHCSVYLLIAGTYTPLALVALHGALGWVYLGITWFLAVLGITLNFIDLKKFEKFSLACYIGMGWVIIWAIKPLSQRVRPEGLVLLVAGGVVYTIGAVFYVIGQKKKYIHSLWHFFVLGGSILQYFSILFYVVLS